MPIDRDQFARNLAEAREMGNGKADAPAGATPDAPPKPARHCEVHGEHTSRTGCPRCRSERIAARKAAGKAGPDAPAWKAELAAMERVYAALLTLDAGARDRVLGWVQRRLEAEDGGIS